MNANNNTNTATSNNANKGVEAFYLKGQTAVSLWVNQVETKGAPDFDGKIGEQRVALRIRNGGKGKFIAITRPLKPAEVGADGYKERQIGSANLIVNDRGIPVLAIKLDDQKGKTIWANVSLKAPQDLMVQAGLDLTILAEKKAAHALRKAAGQVEQEHAEEAVPA